MGRDNQARSRQRRKLERKEAIIVKLLLDSGANVLAETEEGLTALQIAVERDNVEVIQLLEKAISR